MCFCCTLSSGWKLMQRIAHVHHKVVGKTKWGFLDVKRCWSYNQVRFTNYILSRWWFQIFFIFTPNWARFPIWLIFFRWVVQPPTSYHGTCFRHVFAILWTSNSCCKISSLSTKLVRFVRWKVPRMIRIKWSFPCFGCDLGGYKVGPGSSYKWSYKPYKWPKING